MKVTNRILILFFLLAALLQYNDPDPFIWIALYIYGAILCFLAIKGKFHFIFYTIGLAVYLSYAAYLFFDANGVLAWIQEHHAENIAESMKADKPWIEETREFFGLMILVFALLINITRLWSHQKATSQKKIISTRQV